MEHRELLLVIKSQIEALTGYRERIHTYIQIKKSLNIGDDMMSDMFQLNEFVPHQQLNR